MIALRLRLKIWKARRLVASTARERGEVTRVFSFGAFYIAPRHLAVVIVTPTDAERDKLTGQEDLIPNFRAIFSRVGYPSEAIPLIAFVFESQETVDRDYGGNWFYRFK